MRVPSSTYRLQITEDFDLLAAARTLPYLHSLGAHWVYLSPILAAQAGSSHGYDVASHDTIDESRGGEAGLAALSSEARRLGMGVLVDIVPNHVGIAVPWQNRWWWHVLTHGRESSYASAFDIDWDAEDGRILIPVIGDDDLLEDGTIANLRVEAGELHYHDNRFPLAPGTSSGRDAQAVHARQHYRLVSWRLADSDLNYRRFFTINTLAALRVEDPQWFAQTHREIGRWIEEDLVDGLRVDHPDGLRDPAGYLDQLAQLTGGAYVLVEKILEPGEQLPMSWATAGTTGYDALGFIDRVLTDPRAEATLSPAGTAAQWTDLIHDTKRAVADGVLLAETRRIARDLVRDLTEPPAYDDVVDAVAELLACFPVYRSYLPEGREHLEAAVAVARERRADLAPVFDAIVPLLGDGAASGTQRFQQTSGMVMAKGVEDCAFYRWGRLTSLNEVGGDPSVFATSPEDFHEFMAARQQHWPHAMNAATTHDTKRSEDTRARIAALAEIPEEWNAALARLQAAWPLPDEAFAALLWQAILGAWPASRERLHAYAEKAMREAGDHTSWTDVDEEYEAAVHGAVDAAFDREEVRDVLGTLLDRIVDAGKSNALAAKLLTLTVPGVPDVYQGTELWDRSLVDPDNRRPVDFAVRERIVAGLEDGDRPVLMSGPAGRGAAKLALVRTALHLRRDRPDLFARYQPLSAQGSAAEHVLAFDRGGAITVVTRLPLGLADRGGWGDTTLDLPGGVWIDQLSGVRVEGTVPLGELLAERPVALLARAADVPVARGPYDVWAPLATELRLSVGDRTVAMDPGPDGWWRPRSEVDATDEPYGYLVDGATDPVPDPRSRRQPDGVHGPSRRFDPSSYSWRDDAWTGRPLAGSVIYELHLGTFTPEGTLDAAIGKLDHLRDIGVDFVELMPVNPTNGGQNWGYDGVLWHAVEEGYGGPAAYQRFVDACHGAGIGVIQDVVFNHLGPSGNYLPLFGPYLAPGDTPWGDRVNLDGDDAGEVRRYILDAVRMWLDDYHVDGLRLDAVHALVDESPLHLLEEMAVEAAALSAHLRRPLHLIAESDLNDPVLVTPREAGGWGLDAQWSDDFHHALHVALTGETDGYYADFERLGSLAKVLERGFFHDGTWSSFRGRDHGAPIDTDRFPGWRLVVCSQNHDQVGNRARGDRPSERLDDDQAACAALLTLTGPFTPMLFQGEEWAASSPFTFFTDHPEPDLGAAVTRGRFEEFARMGWDRDQVPDPQDPGTFQASKLDWSELAEGRHAVVLEAYRSLAALRRERPELTDPDLRRVSTRVDERRRWLLLNRGGTLVVVNFGEREARIELDHDGFDPRWTSPRGARLDGHTLVLPPHAGAVLVPRPA